MKSTTMGRLPRKAQREVVTVRAAPAAEPLPCPSAGPWPRLFIAATATAFLLWLSYFPVAWGWLGWVALVPLLFLVRSRAPGGRVFLAAWLGALVFFWPALQWMRVADPQMYYTWAALATYCSLYVPVAILLI